MPTFKEKMIAGFDLLFLFGRGVEVFEKNDTRAAALKSLWIMAVLYPFTPLVAYFYPPQGLHDGSYPYSQIFWTVTAQYVFAAMAGVAFAYLFAKMLKAEKHFWLYFQICNWVNLPAMALTLPFFLLAFSDVVPREQMDRILVLLTLYLYLVTGCIAFRAFRINWQLAGFFAMTMLFLHQQVWNLLFYIQDIPLVW